jgi:hypothetical protein
MGKEKKFSKNSLTGGGLFNPTRKVLLLIAFTKFIGFLTFKIFSSGAQFHARKRKVKIHDRNYGLA